MSVFRGDSGNGEVQGPKEARKASGAREASGVDGVNGVTPSAMRRTLARARDGKPLDLDEATVLLHARGEDLQTLLTYASRTRDAGLEAAGRPNIITYSRKVFIPLTRLCRDRCGYCTFATVPHRLDHLYLEPDEVLEIARQGAELGCKEALFTLGDKPEDRWHQARDWLDAHGYDDTLSYVRAMAIRVLEETGLLPHLNPGVLSWQDFQRLKPVAPSMGMMLETTASRLYTDKGGPHFGSPDKDPAVRLRVLEDAGRSNVPFTTGILIGIGERMTERAESVFAIRKVAREYRGIQEVIVQNFRAKPDTKMRDVPDAELDDLAATIAVTRLILGAKARIQAPPNLVGAQYDLILRAGIDDWGGVSPLTPDHVNPERPWPDIDELAAHTAEAGFTLRERLTIYPPYICEPWLDPRLARHVTALADPATGLAAADARPRGLPWQEPDGGWGQWAQDGSGRTDLHVTIDTTGRTHDRRDDFAEVYGDWNEIAERTTVPAPGQALRPTSERPTAGRPAAGGTAAGRPAAGGAPAVLSAGEIAAALRQAERDPAALTDAQAIALLSADGPDLEALTGLADALRRETMGDDVTYVVTRNINFTNVCYTGCRFCAFAQRRTDADAYTLSLQQIGDRAAEAWDAGATEVCMQGGIHPDLPGTAYFEIAAEVKRRQPWPARARVLPDGGDERSLAHRPAGQGVAGAGQGGGGRLAAGDGSGDPRRRRALGADQGQAAGLDVDRGDQHGTPARPADLGHDDVRARRHARALGRPPAGDPVDPGADRRLHRVRAAAVHPRERPHLPGGPGPARADEAGEPGGARDGPAHAARGDRLDPVLLGQAGRRGLPRRTARRRQRPRRDAHGGDHQPDGRRGSRFLQDDQSAPRDRRTPGPPDAPAHHHLRRGPGGTAGRRGRQRRCLRVGAVTVARAGR